MNHADHLNLLRPAQLRQGGRWADLGAGSGAFTLALRELVGPEAEIWAVDKETASLAQLEKAFMRRFGNADRLWTKHQDLLSSDGLPIPLDGVVMANSLHFFKDKVSVLRHVHSLLASRGLLLIVEYNVDRGNAWVPYPLSFESLSALAEQGGFSSPWLLATHPSTFLREIYSAATLA